MLEILSGGTNNNPSNLAGPSSVSETCDRRVPSPRNTGLSFTVTVSLQNVPGITGSCILSSKLSADQILISSLFAEKYAL
jgi:hypothetical protein